MSRVFSHWLFGLLVWGLFLGVILGALAGLGWGLWWLLQQIQFTSVRKLVSFLLFWSFFIALIRMWWQIGSYYARREK